MANRPKNEVVLYDSDDQLPADIREKGITASQWNALSTSIYPGAAPASIMMALDYCVARKLDPLQKPVHIVPMWIDGGMRDVVMPGIGLYRIQAQRSGTYAGMDDIEFGPERESTLKDKDGKPVTVRYPESATCRVYKLIGNQRVQFSAQVFWLEEYATDSRGSTAPNAMWRKRPYSQLAKCAESQALRRAWPEIDAGPTMEEMEGKNQPPPVTGGQTYDHEPEAPKRGTAALKSRVAPPPRANEEAHQAMMQAIGELDTREAWRAMVAKIEEGDWTEGQRREQRGAMQEAKERIKAAEAAAVTPEEQAEQAGADMPADGKAERFAHYQAQLEVVEKAPAIEEIIHNMQNDDLLDEAQRDLLADLAAKKMEDSIPY